MKQSRECHSFLSDFAWDSKWNCFSETAMRDVYGAKYVSLHVRQTNRAAIGLYRDTLGFAVHEVEKAYCKLPSRFDHYYLILTTYIQTPTEKMHWL